MITFPDIYTQSIYNYLRKHGEGYILYKDIMHQYKMSYPTLRKKIKWLEEHHFIKRTGRYIRIIGF